METWAKNLNKAIGFYFIIGISIIGATLLLLGCLIFKVISFWTFTWLLSSFGFLTFLVLFFLKKRIHLLSLTIKLIIVNFCTYKVFDRLEVWGGLIAFYTIIYFGILLIGYRQNRINKQPLFSDEIIPMLLYATVVLPFLFLRNYFGLEKKKNSTRVVISIINETDKILCYYFPPNEQQLASTGLPLKRPRQLSFLFPQDSEYLTCFNEGSFTESFPEGKCYIYVLSAITYKYTAWEDIVKENRILEKICFNETDLVSHKMAKGNVNAIIKIQSSYSPFDLELEKELHNNIVTKEKAHPRAVKIIPYDFFWDLENECAPFGEAVSKNRLEDFRKEKKGIPGHNLKINIEQILASDFHKQMLQIEYSAEYANYTMKYLKEDNYSSLDEFEIDAQIILNKSVLAVGFGQLIEEGKMDKNAKPLVKAAIKRQMKICTLRKDEPKMMEYHSNLEVLKTILETV